MTTTHRVIQLANLLDTLEAKIRLYRRCAINALKIKNVNASNHYRYKIVRYEKVAERCRSRLAVENIK